MKKIAFIASISVLTFCSGVSCSTEMPEGKIVCSVDNYEKECPSGWECKKGLCYKPPVDKTATDAEAKSSSTPDAKSGAVADEPVSGCVPIDCEGRCGSFEGCFGTIDCGECKTGFECSANGECIPTCGGCDIDGVCYETGMKNPRNGCEVCSPANSTSAWSPDNGAVCDDGKFCTVSDKCVDKECQGETRSCDDGREITADTCSDTDAQCDSSCKCEAPQVCDFADDNCGDHCADNQCNIDEVCYDDGYRRATNPCQVCDVKKNPTAWSVDVGYVCGSNSGNACLGQNTCDASGECVQRFAPVGTGCNDTNQTECSAPDTCDGHGKCNSNHYGLDRTCGGDPGKCGNQRRCDGNGQCGGQTYRTGAKCANPADSECSSGSFCNDSGACILESFTGQACGATAGVCENQRVCSANGQCGNTSYKKEGTQCANATECSSGSFCNGSGGCVLRSKTGNCGGTPGACENQRVCNANGQCSNPTYKGTSTVCAQDTECANISYCNGSGGCAISSKTGKACGATAGVCENQRVCDANGRCGNQTYKLIMTACAQDTECTNISYCDGFGGCMLSSKTGRACGGTPGLCENQRTCNSNGTCNDKTYKSNGAQCLPAKDATCNSISTCDANHNCNLQSHEGQACENQCQDGTCSSLGICSLTNKADGTACNGTPQTCNQQDTCLNGQCQDHGFIDVGTACTGQNQNQQPCTGTCDANGRCTGGNCGGGGGQQPRR